jgi:hypothetical protein
MDQLVDGFHRAAKLHQAAAGKTRSPITIIHGDAPGQVGENVVPNTPSSVPLPDSARPRQQCFGEEQPMPMNSAQLAALVERARQKAPPRRHHAATPGADRTTPSAGNHPCSPPRSPRPGPATAVQAVLPPVLPLPETADTHAQHTAQADDFPTGWGLRKESWHFSTAGSTACSAGQWLAANTRTSSGRSDAVEPSISPTTAGGSRCRTAGAHWRFVPPAGGCSPFCPGPGSRR